MAGNNHIRCPQCGVPNEPGALFCSRCGASLNRPGYAGTRRRGVSAAGFAMALALLLALAILVFVLYTIVTRVLAPTETTLDPYAGTSGTVATLYTSTTGSATDSTGTTDAAGAIQVRPDSATASSSLTATLISDFQPTNLLDGDPASAWNEGADGPGIGEWVLYDFGEPVPLARIEIANGYQRDEERFAGDCAGQVPGAGILGRDQAVGAIARRTGAADHQARGQGDHPDHVHHHLGVSALRMGGRSSLRDPGVREHW